MPLFREGSKTDRPRDGAPKSKPSPPPKRLRVSLGTRLRNSFLAGMLVTAPFGLTVWVTWNIIGYIDDRVTPLIPKQWNPETYLPFSVPGLGLLFSVIVLIFIGFLAAGLVGRVMMRQGEAIMARVPVVRSVYSATKQIFETVFAERSNALRQVCLIEYPCRGTWAVGFVTGRTVGEVQSLTDDTVINVFVPATPNPTTGFLLFVPERDVHILDFTVEEGIKLVISGGIVEPPKRDGPVENGGSIVPAHEEAKKTRPAKAGAVARLRNYFFAGVLVAAPISITLWLVWKFVTFIDAQVTPLIPPQWNPEEYLPFDVPGLGVLVSVVGLTLIGMFAAGYLGRLVMRTGESMLAQVPVVRSLYSGLKQVFESVLAKRSNAFREVVLIQYPRPDVWALGFFTGKTESHVQSSADRKVINVFLPTTPNPTSGFLLFVGEDEVETLTMTVEEGLKMVVSGGIVTPPDRRPVEGPDEGHKEADVATAKVIPGPGSVGHIP